MDEEIQIVASDYFFQLQAIRENYVPVDVIPGVLPQSELEFAKWSGQLLLDEC